jgi:segregation and condensation protein A
MDAVLAERTADLVGDGEGTTPRLTLDRFSGPLERLLLLARAHQIDLAHFPVAPLVEQLAAALQRAGRGTPLGQQADWVVMTAWLVLLRSQLLLPAGSPAQRAAEAEAGALQARLVALRDMQALAGWLEHRPQLGHDVFARGQPEAIGTAFEPAHQVDVVEFLWASLALFDDAAADLDEAYRPVVVRLHDVNAARARILRLLAATPESMPFERFLPEPPEDAAAESDARRALRRRSSWATTLVAGLELAKAGEVVLGQAGEFQGIQLAPGAPEPAPDSTADRAAHSERR